jgi:predicted ATP-grasp superfamily ATP-dependent carboligase
VAAAGEGFERDELLAAARGVIATHRPGLIVCGSGFESRPELLEDLARLAPLRGNTAQTVRAVTQPSSLFPALLQQRIDFPQTVTGGAIPDGGWLEKQIGGCGGGHVRPARSGGTIVARHYAQRHVAGVSMSAVFIADGGQSAELLGTSRHWCAQPGQLTPYQHSGLVTEAVDKTLTRLLSDWVSRLTRTFALRGLCGFDFVLEQPGRPLLVDVNPRPPASFELFETVPPSLFAAHVEYCNGGGLCRPAPVSGARAQAVYYAGAATPIPASCDWPDWVADIPVPGTRVAAGHPLCTIRGSGANAQEAVELVRARCGELAALLRETTAAESD